MRARRHGDGNKEGMIRCPRKRARRADALLDEEDDDYIFCDDGEREEGIDE